MLRKSIKNDAEIDNIFAILKKEVAGYTVPVVELIKVQSDDPYRILVGALLSARTLDQTTAVAAARLFAKAPDLASLARLPLAEIQKLIYPVGFYRTKASHLRELPAALTRFNGRIPETLDDLLTLPGVGRKTANLVLSVAFNQPAICVDTHVHRIVNIWGYVHTKTPLATELALRKKLPLRHWQSINSNLVAFGQGTCRPIAPHCDCCVIEHLCPQINVSPRKKQRSAAAGSPQTV